jgi:hypothetical protein
MVENNDQDRNCSQAIQVCPIAQLHAILLPHNRSQPAAAESQVVTSSPGFAKSKATMEGTIKNSFIYRTGGL